MQRGPVACTPAPGHSVTRRTGVRCPVVTQSTVNVITARVPEWVTGGSLRRRLARLRGDQARYPGTSWVIWRTSSDLCPGAARARLRTKWFAVLVRPKDVRLFPLMRRSQCMGTAGPAAAGMVWRPCCGRHRCWVRGSRRPGGGERRCAARAGCCPAGTTVPGPGVRWSCPAVLVPLVTARVLRRRLR